MSSSVQYKYDLYRVEYFFQLFLLKIMSSGSVDKGINFSSQLEYVRMLVNIGSDSSNVKNSLVAVQTLESVFQFDPLFSDHLRIWLHSMPLENRFVLFSFHRKPISD